MEFIKRYKLTVCAVVLILIGILMPASEVPSVGIPHMDKVVHCGMFGFVTLCFYGEYTWYKKKLPPFLTTWLFIEAFAVFTEILQLFANGRSCDPKDMIADSVGVLLAVGIAYLVRQPYIDKVNRMK